MKDRIRILSVYDQIESAYPGLTTWRILRAVAQECECEVYDVSYFVFKRDREAPKVKCGEIVVSDGKTFRVVATDGPFQIRAIPFPGDDNAESVKLSAWSKK